MPISTFPIAILDSNCVSAFDADPPSAKGRPRAEELVNLARVGDSEAFTEIYHLHKKRVFNICFRMVRDFCLAEDLTQDAFFQLHRKIGLFRGDSAFTTWLHRITVNVVLMHLRKHVLLVDSLDQMASHVPEVRGGREFGTRDLALAGVADRLTLEGAVNALAPGYRSIYVLHDVDGFDHVEIAQMRNCSTGTSKSQLHKARKALKSALRKPRPPCQSDHIAQLT